MRYKLWPLSLGATFIADGTVVGVCTLENPAYGDSYYKLYITEGNTKYKLNTYKDIKTCFLVLCEFVTKYYSAGAEG